MNEKTKKTTSSHKQKKRAALSIFLVVAILITTAFAFLSATDSKTNVFTVGNIQIELAERFDKNLDGSIDESTEVFDVSNLENSDTIQADGYIVPGQTVLKQPYVKNTGDNDAWVFISVGIPTATSAQISGNSETMSSLMGSTQSIEIQAYAIQENYKKQETLNDIWSSYFAENNTFGNKATVTEDRVEIFKVNGLSASWQQIYDGDIPFVYQADNGKNYYVFAYNSKLPAKNGELDTNSPCLFESVTLIDSIGTPNIYTLSFPEGNVYKDTNTYSVSSSAPVLKFASVQIDGMTVDSDDFTVSGVGETVVTFTDKDMLMTLSTSEHDVDIIATDGDADGVFTRKDIDCSHSFDENHVCTLCGDEEPGFYDENNNFVVSWDESGLDATRDYDYLWYTTRDGNGNITNRTPYGENHFTTEQTSGYNVLQQYPTTTKIVIPNTLQKLGQAVFDGCSNVKEIYISDATTDIGNVCFGDMTGITSINYGANVSSLSSASAGSDTLLNINIDPDNDNYCDVNGVAFTADKATLIEYPAGKPETTYNIPASVATIGKNAFAANECLTTMDIPETVNNVEEWAFASCKSLTTVSFPDTVTVINPYVFSENQSLKTVHLGTSVISIGDSAFSVCMELETINIPETTQTIGKKAFNYCFKLDNVNLTSNLTSLGDYAFYKCKTIQNIIIPNSLLSIGEQTFRDCVSLKSVQIEDGVTSVARSMFYGCTSLNAINIPDSITIIDKYAFRGCTSLNDIVVGKNVETIEYAAFFNSGNLKTVTLPKKLTTIGDGAFYGSGTKTVNYEGSESDKLNIQCDYTRNPTLSTATWNYNYSY